MSARAYTTYRRRAEIHFEGVISVSGPINKENYLMPPPVNEQYIVGDKGNTTALILPINDYKKILSILEQLEDHKETTVLSQPAQYKRLLDKGLKEASANRIKPWKEVRDDL